MASSAQPPSMAHEPQMQTINSIMALSNPLPTPNLTASPGPSLNRVPPAISFDAPSVGLGSYALSATATSAPSITHRNSPSPRPRKRARSPSYDDTSEDCPPRGAAKPPIKITRKDVESLPIEALQSIILHLLPECPAGHGLVAEYIREEKEKRDAEAAQRKLNPPIDLSSLSSLISSQLNVYRGRGESREDAARLICADTEEIVVAIRAGCEKSDRYETRLSALRVLVDIAEMVAQCDDETLRDEIIGCGTGMEEEMSEIWERMIANEEVDRMRAETGLLESIKELEEVYGCGDFDIEEGAFSELAESMGC